MGYTHYWSKAGPFSNAQWAALTEAAEAIVKQAKSDGLLLCWEYDEPAKDPEISAAAIRFNGVHSEGHETFLLSPQAEEFEFCKTAAKPYDAAVVAMLVFAKQLAPELFNWRSDGLPEDHADGLALLTRANGLSVESNASSNEED